MRKIIQIISHAEPGSYPYIAALCDDGTAWEYIPSRPIKTYENSGYTYSEGPLATWKQMPDIPQPQENQPVTDED